MVYYVYILQSEKDGSYYIGSTQDVTERLHRHNNIRGLEVILSPCLVHTPCYASALCSAPASVVLTRIIRCSMSGQISRFIIQNSILPEISAKTELQRQNSAATSRYKLNPIDLSR